MAHAASIVRKYLVGKAVNSVVAVEDALVFSKPLTADIFKETVSGKTVAAVNRHGKYFWIRFNDSPTVMLLHFGMTGWVKVKGIQTHFLVMENGGDKKAAEQLARNKAMMSNDTFVAEKDPNMEWPPKFHKFILKADDDTELAFTDPRRLGRIRLLEAETDEQLMKMEPLKRNGSDFSKQSDTWTLDKFCSEVSRRKVPIKSLIMDQALFAGVGNWIA